MKNAAAMISKDETKILKGIAIILVIVSHYYRYCCEGMLASLLGSVGFFGAALFAFLSGYGLEKSYQNSGIYRGWIVKKIKGVIIPFWLVNLLSIFLVYQNFKEKIVWRAISGCDDFVLWYVPFIMGFYLVFYFATKISAKNHAIILGTVGIVYIAVMMVCQTSSNWYTATAALILGVECAKNIRMFGVVLSGGGTLVFTVISQYYDNIQLIKDVSTLLAGALFSLCMIQILNWIQDKKPRFLLALIIGDGSYWIYLTHMKIMYALQKSGVINLFLFLFLSLLVGLGLNFLYASITTTIERWKNTERK